MSERERLAEFLESEGATLAAVVVGLGAEDKISAKYLRAAALLRSTESDERKDAVVGDARAFLVEVNQGGTWYRCAGHAYLWLEEAQRCVDRMIGDFSASSYRITPLFARPTEKTRSSGAEEADAAWAKVEDAWESAVIAEREFGNPRSRIYAVMNAVRAEVEKLRAEIRATKGGAE